MSTVILLSSSPPRVFARTPTPVGSSSPALPSASSIFKGGVKGYKKFKAAAVQRDGFTGGFTSCAALLRTKIGAENVPLPKQMNQKALKEPTPSQKLPKDQDIKDNTTAKIHYKVSKLGVEEGQQSRHGSEKENRHDGARSTQSSVRRAEKIEEQRPSSLSLDKAPSRRLDWTSPVASAPTLIEPNSPSSSTRSFPGGLLINFGYSTFDTEKVVAPKRDDEGGPTKRRRIDLIETGTRRASTSMPTPPFTEESSAKASAATRKRNKSPAKKYTTITRLATSNYRENELGQGKVTPKLQYLTATQARAVDDSEEPLANTVKEKPKRAPKKLKKTVSRFKVLSPESAMKAFDSQEMMFGSASQLARDESPSFMRDTFEAMKQSESFLMSDPVSTQLTQPISVESTTPRTGRGTTRFTKTRNLWSAAGRDEDNALLHVDTMDLFDLPDLRFSFAGKDVLLEPGASRHRQSRSPEKQSPSLRGSQSPIQDSALFRCYDIDDITTPVARAPAPILSRIQARGLHTAASNSIAAHTGPEEVAAPVTEDTSLATAEMDQRCDATQPAALSKVTSKPKPEPRKPVYAGFATHDLQKQISAFGFKPIKKREKMIEILERCWEDKHGPSTEDAPNADATVAESVEALTHGDFLSKVHDISSRPLPKVNKPKGRPKKDNTEGSAENDAAKSPKKRKRAEPKVKAVKVAAMNKTPRKREPRASSLSEVFVVDVDDIEESAIKSVNPSPPVKATPRRKSSAKAVSQPLPSTTRLATPPPTLPVKASSSSPTFEPASLLRPQDTATNELPTASTNLSSSLPLPDIQSQITQAITTSKAPKDHNHQTNPTWHEKILMYDPIVLEDLAAWLNTEGLGAIGDDREVSALEVRTWCEAKGVCCLWKGGWRGNKARKDED